MVRSSGHKRSGEASGLVGSVKRPRLLINDDDSASDDANPFLQSNGAPSGEFVINKEFAKRFEHNKKREELQQLEAKYGLADSGKGTLEESSDSDGSSTSEDEDDDGVLASEAIDAEILRTLNAIRTKDPRIYDKASVFYKESEADDQMTREKTIHEKPMHLKEYHRKMLLSDLPSQHEVGPSTYGREQADIKNDLVRIVNDAEDNEGKDEDEGEDFLIAKPSHQTARDKASFAKPLSDEIDVNNAEKDPDNFLSQFMSARAWIPTENSRFQPFDSDSDGEENKAEQFEQAYNLRFEDPSKSNETLVSHARDVVDKMTVRKSEKNARQRARDVERQERERAKELRHEEKKRLRKLRIAEAEEKARLFSEAAGITGNDIDGDAWRKFIEEGWDDGQWEEEMRRRFGDDYYASREPDAPGTTNSKIKKPKWADEIEIEDLIPNADAESGEEGEDAAGKRDEDGVCEPTGDVVAKNDITASKKDKRVQRLEMEHLIDQKLHETELLTTFGKRKKHDGMFRYREVSPLTFGLGAQDILMASDSQLNAFAGPKKLAAFRDPSKKQADRQRLSKSSRVKKWRKETFGDANGPKQSFAEYLAQVADAAKNMDGSGNRGETKASQRKRRKKGKGL